MVVNFLGEILYLSPVTCIPHRRAVESVAGLDWTGLGVLTVFISQDLSSVAVPRGPVRAHHSPGHQTNPTGSRAWTPLSCFPPVNTMLIIKLLYVMIFQLWTFVVPDWPPYIFCVRSYSPIIQSIKDCSQEEFSQSARCFHLIPWEDTLAVLWMCKFMKVKFMKVNTREDKKSYSRDLDLETFEKSLGITSPPAFSQWPPWTNINSVVQHAFKQGDQSSIKVCFYSNLESDVACV